jgi:Rod binding domain-containing protein
MIPQIGQPSGVPDQAPTLRRKAEALEAAFLAEMLGHAGMGGARHAFGGGAGEEQFESFLRQAQAEALVRRGGVGLAEHIMRALVSRGGDAA